MKATIVIDTQFCKGCRLCIVNCPREAIRVATQLNAKGYAYAELDETKECTGCGTCALMCPEAAIEVYRE